jgi:hypothetical protein
MPVSLSLVQTVGTLTVGLAGLAVAAWTTWLTSMRASREAHAARLWEKRGDVYAELLSVVTRGDVQEFAAPGSTSWESYFTRDLHGRVLAFASLSVRRAYIRFVTSLAETDRKRALSDLQRAVIDDLQSDKGR